MPVSKERVELKNHLVTRNNSVATDRGITYIAVNPRNFSGNESITFIVRQEYWLCS